MKEQYIKIDSDGNKFYTSDKDFTVLHREDGPAAEYASGDKFWYVNGRAHRIDGPAYEYANGQKSWYLHGILRSEWQWLKEKAKPTINLDGTIIKIDGIEYKLTAI